jgi:hypothetical protein
MSPRSDNEPPDNPGPRKPILRRKNWQWAKIDHYPLLDLERIRGVAVYRTLAPAPLFYRIVIHHNVGGKYRVPAVVAIKNERDIRFGRTAPVEFGVLAPGQAKVTEWFDDLPLFTNKDVIHSNPDFVEFKP